MNRENGKNITVHLTEEQINKRIAEIGAAITERFQGEEVFLVCILKGSIFFTTELAKRIDLPVEIDFMTVSSYGAQTVSSGVINVKQDLAGSIEGKNVEWHNELIFRNGILWCYQCQTGFIDIY